MSVGRSWAEKMLSSAALEAGRLSGPEREIAVAAIAELGKATGPLERLGRAKGRELLGKIKEGDLDGARSIKYGDERDKILDRLREANEKDRQAMEAEKDWEALWTAIGKAGLEALEVAIPLLLAFA